MRELVNNDAVQASRSQRGGREFESLLLHQFRGKQRAAFIQQNQGCAAFFVVLNICPPPRVALRRFTRFENVKGGTD